MVEMGLSEIIFVLFLIKVRYSIILQNQYASNYTM